MELGIIGTLGLNIPKGDDVVDYDKFLVQNFNKIDTFVGDMAKNWPVLGVAPGSLQVVPNTGMTVKVRPGIAVIKGHFFSLTSEQVLTIPAAHATLGRIDRVALRLDWATGLMTLFVKQGTAAEIYAEPMLTMTDEVWEMPLAAVYVDPGVTSIASNKIGDERINTDIEAGVNINGSYTKFPDGTLICTQNNTIASANTAFYNRNWAFPATFIGNVAVGISAYNNYWGENVNNCATTYCYANGQAWRVGVNFGASIPTGYNIYVSVTAIGRWR